jgi:hypothetical protein
MVPVDLNTLDLFLEYFPGCHQVCGTRCTLGHLAGAENDLFDIGACSDFRVENSEFAGDGALVDCVLEPVDEFLMLG